jgi:hypothetical protein
MEISDPDVRPAVHPPTNAADSIHKSDEADGNNGGKVVGNEAILGPATHDAQNEPMAFRGDVGLTPFLGEDCNTPKLWTERFHPLQQYITRANKHQRGGLCLRTCGSTSVREFEPTLGMGYKNRIVVFAGCFNPPHGGHMELLSYAYLRTDDKTVAVIILPTDDNCNKAYTEVGDHKVNLSKAQRVQLWEDDMVGLFTWIWTGPRKSSDEFKTALRRQATEDGYYIDFTDLTHMDLIIRV